MSPRKVEGSPWPWPADTPLDRARRVAQAYRHALNAAADEACAQLDKQMITLRQTWVVPSANVYEPDDLLTAELAADAANVEPRTIYAWRSSGLKVTSTPDGPRYRFGDLQEFRAERRRKRA